MSFAATRWAWSQATGRSSSKLVLLALADRADDAGLAYPSIATLATDTGLDRKTVMPALAHLESLGLIACARAAGTGSRYQLNLALAPTLNREPQPVPKTGPVQKTAPVPKTGPHQSQKRDRTSPKNGTRTYQEPIKNLNTPPIPPSDPVPGVVADATGVGAGARDGQKRTEEPAARPPPSKPPGPHPGWDAFWAAYPRKQARRAALAAWNKARPSPELLTRILADIPYRLAGDDQWQRGYIPHPATYLNGARWEDALTPKPGDRPHAAPRESATERFHRLNDTPLAELLAGAHPAATERVVAGEVVSSAAGGVRGAVVVPISDARGYGGAQARVVGAGA